MTTTNLFIASNAVTLLTAHMIIQEKHQGENNTLMLIANALDKQFLNTMSYMANALKSFNKIVLFNNYCTKQVITTKALNEHEDIYDFEKLENELQINGVDNIYVSFLYYQTRTIIDHYTNANVYGLDNGTGSYEPQMVAQELLTRFNGVYTFNYFDKIFPQEALKENPIQNIQINKEKFKDILQLFANDINVQEDKNAVILCAQNISLSHKVISTQDEYDIYIDTAFKIIKAGYNVYFKEHPKTPMYFQQKIREINHPNFKLLCGTTPIEMLVPKIKPVAIVGIFTTSLLLVPHLFNIPAYVISNKNNFANTPAYKYAYALIKSYLPDVKELYNNNLTTDITDIHSQYQPLTNLLHISLTNENMSEDVFIKTKEYIQTKEFSEFEYFNIPEKLFNIFKNSDYSEFQKYLKAKI